LDFRELLDFREVVWRFERGSFLTLTPSCRASESPMAMACLRLFAFPLPRFIFRISCRTYSPAWVEAALPCRFLVAARLLAFVVGMLELNNDRAFFEARTTPEPLFLGKLSLPQAITDRVWFNGTAVSSGASVELFCRP
jgi:hypothetical protein